MVQDGGEDPWRQDFVSCALAARRRPTDITLITPHGSVFHWGSADDLPGPEVDNAVIADALTFVADPDVIGVLRQIVTEGTSRFDGNAREHQVVSRLIEEGYASYHFGADGEHVMPTCRGLLVATMALLLAAVPGMGRGMKGRGVNTSVRWLTDDGDGRAVNTAR